MKPWGQRIRAFVEQLLTSRHVRFLEAEMIRVRLEKDAQLRTLQEEKLTLLAKIEKLELAIWPLASRSGAIYAAPPKKRNQLEDIEYQQVNATPAHFDEALAEHFKELDRQAKES